MAKLIYTVITSLDGYVEDQHGKFDWAAPDEEVHRFVNDLERPIGTYLCGRRLYDVMRYWDTAHEVADQPAYVLDYAAIWQAADKVVFSKTLEDAPTEKTRVEREFDTEAIGALVAATDGEMSVGGPELAAHAIRAGLVDEFRQLLSPVVVGGGKRFLPDDVRIDLELLEERKFGNGVVYLSHRVRAA